MEQSYFVYILRCRDNSLYTGITNDIENRLKQHAAGVGSKYVRSRLPFTLVYQEEISTRSLALQREAAIKKLTKQEKKKLLKVM